MVMAWPSRRIAADPARAVAVASVESSNDARRTSAPVLDRNDRAGLVSGSHDAVVPSILMGQRSGVS